MGVTRLLEEAGYEVILLYYSGNEGRDNIRWEAVNEGTRKNPADKRRGIVRSWLMQNSTLARLVWMNVLAQLAQKVTRTDAPALSTIESEWTATERALERFKETVGERPLTLWYLPSRMEWDDEHWGFMQSEHGLTDDADRHLLRTLVEGWSRENGLMFIDMTAALLHRSASGIRIPGDGHYTAEAHRRMAQILIDHGGAASRLRNGTSARLARP